MPIWTAALRRGSAGDAPSTLAHRNPATGSTVDSYTVSPHDDLHAHDQGPLRRSGPSRARAVRRAPRSVGACFCRALVQMPALTPCARTLACSACAHRGTLSITRSRPPSRPAGAGAAQPYGPLPLLPYEHADSAPGCSFVTRVQLGASADAVVGASISGFQLNRRGALIARFWRTSSRSRAPSPLHRTARSTPRSLRQAVSRAARRVALRGPTSERPESSRDLLCLRSHIHSCRRDCTTCMRWHRIYVTRLVITKRKCETDPARRESGE